MRTLFIITLLFSQFLFAQHVDLNSQRWFVKNITINGVVNEFPQDNVEFPLVDIYLNNAGSNLVTSSNLVVNENCQIGFTGHVLYTSTDTINFNDYTPFSTTTACNINSLSDFMSLYVNFYSDEITEPFTYIITDFSNYKTLILTNNAGDKIEYSTKIFEEVPGEIVDVSWILTDLTIDNVYYSPPNNTEVNIISVIFNNTEINNFSTGVCNGIFGIHNFNAIENQFHLYELNTTLGGCNIWDNQEFENLYLGFFWNNASNPLTYEISGEFLTITDILGNTAQYHNGIVNIDTYIDAIANIYPNPVENRLTIEEKSNVLINNIDVYSILGKKIFSTSKNTIDMSKFNKGVYLLKIKLQNGKNAVKKIIKS